MYKRQLQEASLHPDEALEFTSAHSVEDAAELVARILEDGAADAILAANNRAAIGALRTFQATGRRLPLVAFDDFEAADIVQPQVSVVSQDIRLMGQRAGEILLERLQGLQRPPETIVLPTQLVLRGSERPT